MLQAMSPRHRLAALAAAALSACSTPPPPPPAAAPTLVVAPPAPAASASAPAANAAAPAATSDPDAGAPLAPGLPGSLVAPAALLAPPVRGSFSAARVRLPPRPGCELGFIGSIDPPHVPRPPVRVVELRLQGETLVPTPRSARVLAELKQLAR
jgi:hypothetical protein